MQDIPQGWATIDAAVVTVVGGALLSMLGFVLHRLRKVQTDAAITRDHVANSHVDEQGNPINLRDDQDAKHEEIKQLVAEVAEGINGRLDVVERDISGMKRDVGRLADADLEQVRQMNRDRERVDELARTLPKARVQKMVEKANEHPDN